MIHSFPTMSFMNEADCSTSQACLKNFDALLQCPICFDLLSIAMMTKCSHNFCSLCIRKFLSYKLQCPVCNSQNTEQDLRNNRLLDDLVANFKAMRQQLSKGHFDSLLISPKIPASAIKCKAEKASPPVRDGTILSHFFHKGSKISTSAKEMARVASAQFTLKEAMQHATNDVDTTLPVAVQEEPLEQELSAHNMVSVKTEKIDVYFPVTQPSKAGSLSPLEDLKPVIKVECPVCSVGISQHFINKHLDTCLASGEKKESLRSSGGSSGCNRRRPMGKLVYNLLSMQELKRKLKECHMSVQGTRDQLVKRHQEFVHMYNAQCDSLNPKSAYEIAKDVEANEKTKCQLQGKAKPVLVFSKNQTQEEIDELHSNYRKQHSSEFSQLIAKVRGHLVTSRQTQTKQDVHTEREEAQGLHATDEVAESMDCTVSNEDQSLISDTEAAEEIPGSASPLYSDVSISSSISDIFGPEASTSFEDVETSGRKRASSSREGTPPLILGKRCRKS